MLKILYLRGIEMEKKEKNADVFQDNWLYICNIPQSSLTCAQVSAVAEAKAKAG